MNLHYTAPSEYNLADELLGTIGSARMNNPGDTANAAPTGYRGAFDSIIKMLKGGHGTLKGVPGSDGSSGDTSGDSSATTTANTSTDTASFGWKERATFICDQISKREMNPDDYGCMQDTTIVSDNFSYRGYAKMICSRLATNYDPGIPELCGCPPPEWPGWRQ